MKLGKAKCKLVDFNFIEDCLQHKKGPKLLAEGGYEIKKKLAEARKEKKPQMRKKEDQGRDKRVKDGNIWQLVNAGQYEETSPHRPL